MSSLTATRRQLQSAEMLQGVVTTMKTLSAVRITQYRRSVAALQESQQTLELAVQALLSWQPDLLPVAEPGADSSLAIIILGSDRGLCGPFNERITRHAAGLLAARTPAGQTPSILSVGRRLDSRLENAGYQAAARVDPPGNVDSIDEAVVAVLAHVERWQAEGRAQRLYVAYNRPLRGATYQSQAVRILPVDSRWIKRLRDRDWPTNRLPISLGDQNALLRGVVNQFIAHTLVRSFAASQASENAARLAAMDAAERNIEERLHELQTAHRQARQNTVTAELLDVQSAFAATSE